jgi:hypothetical protein
MSCFLLISGGRQDFFEGGGKVRRPDAMPMTKEKMIAA